MMTIKPNFTHLSNSKRHQGGPRPTATLVAHYSEISKVSRPIDLIVLHCSATSIDRPYSPSQLIADHLQRGFIHAGYHYYITRNGDLFTLRPLSMIGAHTLGYNDRSIGICYEGGLDEKGLPADTRTKFQKIMLDQLLLRLSELWPEAKIRGHRELSRDLNGDGRITPNEWSKVCPCFNVYKEYGEKAFL